MMVGRTVTTFLIDGEATGRATFELSNWVGKAIRVPRTLLRESLERREFASAAVYFLFGRGEEADELNRVYVGESDTVAERLIQHSDKEFWTEAFVVVSKDDQGLNKAHIKYLESLAISEARLAGRFRLENQQAPSRPTISESERAFLEEFFSFLKVLIAAAGYRLFVPLRQSPRPTARDPEGAAALVGVSPRQLAIETTVTTPALQPIEASITHEDGVARAVVTDEGIVVLEGSPVRQFSGEMASYARLRQRLLDLKVLHADADGRILFSSDYRFDSPSAAATVILGRSANGRLEFRSNDGSTLSQLYA